MRNSTVNLKGEETDAAAADEVETKNDASGRV